LQIAGLQNLQIGGPPGPPFSFVKLSIRPLTPDLWPALDDLFGKLGACGGCWCMYWRIGADYKRRGAASNKRAFRKVVEHGPPPGLIAFDGDVAVGWCQITPRDTLPILDKTWRLKRVDDLPVWSISCLYVRKGLRKKGVTSALIAAAISYAKRANAPAIEGYPFDGDVSPSATGTGYLSTYTRLGFEEVARRDRSRPIVRIDLKRSARGSASAQAAARPSARRDTSPRR
jgi:GNAT superfamily N-acetyltransferase